MPPEDLQLITVAAHQRALVLRHGKPVKWLGPGQHQVWTLEWTLVGRGSIEQVARPAVAIEVVDTSGIEAPPLRDDVRPLVPAADYVEATAAEGSVVLRYVDGVLEAVLPAGRHAAWTTTRKVLLSGVDLRERLLHVAGQEVMTKDRVSLRLNLSAPFRVADARRLATVARTPEDVLYLATQLDAEVRSRVERVGLALLTFGVKDVILPGR